MTLPPVLPVTSRVASDANVGLGCARCAFLSPCGGVYDAFDCLTTCCRKPKSCRVACPLSERFGEFVTDSGGWDKSLANVQQVNRYDLPRYVPLIQHRYSRIATLEEQVVALPTMLVSGLLRQNPSLDGDQIRKLFHLATSTEIILVSVAQDAELERFWRDMRFHNIPSALAKLRILHITAPNFSFPISLPRTEALTNRSRIVAASEQLSAAGLSVIPHLNATHENDWTYWTDFLKERSDIYWICKEFQTGLKNKAVSGWHIDQLKKLQDRIGRAIGLLAVGGRGALQQLAGMNISIVDSAPFIKAANRQIFTGKRPPWQLEAIPRGTPIDEHLRTNIKLYREDTELRFEAIQKIAPVPIEQSRGIPQGDVRRKAVASTVQQSLWPDMYLAKSA